ncbi:MAG: hypothetical protein PVI40_06415 [Chlamydiota bacterium]|jgi:hypothetical protein
MNIETEITLSLQKKLRKRGFLFSSLGAFFLFFGATFLSVQTLEEWGIWFFLSAITFIHIGLKPIQEAKKRKLTPDTITIKKDKLLYIHAHTSQEFSFEDIEKILFLQRRKDYGILIKNNQKKIYMPFFTKEAYQKLLSYSNLQNIMHS